MEWIYKYISVTAIIGVLGLSIRYLIQKKIDSYFNKKLENYKHELSVITENVKYDINRKLFDFEAYASKKHAVYPELYSLALEPWNELSIIRFNFDNDIMFSKANLDATMLASSFYEEIDRISAKQNEAFKNFYKNELYLSKDAAIAYDDALRAQNKFLKQIMSSFTRNIKNDDWQAIHFHLIDVSYEYFSKANDKMKVLKEIIYKELSYTHFEEIEKKEEVLS